MFKLVLSFALGSIFAAYSQLPYTLSDQEATQLEMIRVAGNSMAEMGISDRLGEVPAPTQVEIEPNFLYPVPQRDEIGDLIATLD